MFNIQNICPTLYTAVWNSYHLPSNVLVGKKTILLQNGTTQGDPLGMAIYRVGLQSLSNLISNINLVPKWYADEGNDVGKIHNLVEPLKQLKTHGPFFGYHVKKCYLITKYLAKYQLQLNNSKKLMSEWSLVIDRDFNYNFNYLSHFHFSDSIAIPIPRMKCKSN